MSTLFKRLPDDLVWTRERKCPHCQSVNIQSHELTGVVLEGCCRVKGVTAYCRDCKRPFGIDQRLTSEDLAKLFVNPTKEAA